MNAATENRRETAGKPGRLLRWSIGAVGLAVAPKCLMCVFGYLALAAGAQVEICGAGPQQAELARFLAPILAVGSIVRADGKTASP